jgi:histidine triad (HIT) family protein
MSDCIFCKIINKEIPSEIIDENEHVIIFKDLNPKAPIHYLVVPKVHITNINEIDDTDEHYTAIREMFKMIRKLAKNLPEPKAFTLVSNNGKQAGQCVFHMHWHFLSGKNLSGKHGL